MKTTKLTTKLAVFATLALLAAGAVRSLAPTPAQPTQAKITTAPHIQLADGTETRGGGKGKRYDA